MPNGSLLSLLEETSRFYPELGIKRQLLLMPSKRKLLLWASSSPEAVHRARLERDHWERSVFHPGCQLPPQIFRVYKHILGRSLREAEAEAKTQANIELVVHKLRHKVATHASHKHLEQLLESSGKVRREFLESSLLDPEVIEREIAKVSLVMRALLAALHGVRSPRSLDMLPWDALLEELPSPSDDEQSESFPKTADALKDLLTNKMSVTFEGMNAYESERYLLSFACAFLDAPPLHKSVAHEGWRRGLHSLLKHAPVM